MIYIYMHDRARLNIQVTLLTPLCHTSYQMTTCCVLKSCTVSSSKFVMVLQALPSLVKLCVPLLAVCLRLGHLHITSASHTHEDI